MSEPFNELDNMGVAKHTQQALMNPDWPVYRSLEKEITFDGSTTDAIGNDGGSQDPYTLLTITGTVELSIIAICTTDLAGATATVELGTSKNTAGLIAQTTATDIDDTEIWHDTSPDASVEADGVIGRYLVTEDVILTVGTSDVTGGKLKFIIRWAPISTDGNVVVA